MRKISAALLLIMLCTFAVCGIAIHKHVDNNGTCSFSCVHSQKAVLAKVDTNKKCLSEAKTACKKESQSVFSKLFTFEIPKLPLEDFFLAAQKALVEKLF